MKACACIRRLIGTDIRILSDEVRIAYTIGSIHYAR